MMENKILDKYREEAENAILSVAEKHITHIRREDVINLLVKVRLMSVETFEKVFEAGRKRGWFEALPGNFENETKEVMDKSEYLSTHTPPLIDLEVLFAEAFDKGHMAAHLMTDCILGEHNENHDDVEKFKQQYISEKIKSLI